MNELLVSYDQFEAPDLARQLNGLVMQNQDMLALRGLRGVIARYGVDEEYAENRIRRAQSSIGSVQHFAVVNDAGNVFGAASYDHAMPLRKLHLPLPPALAFGPLVDDGYKYASPNVCGWVDDRASDRLFAVYHDLRERVRVPSYDRDTVKLVPWTLEPTRSPDVVHKAIIEAGFKKVATRRFDDLESRRHIPPRQTLYARLKYQWDTAHGKQKELKTGTWGLVEDLGRANNEAASRNPRG